MEFCRELRLVFTRGRRGEWHKGVLGWVKALNHLYTQTPALFEQDYNPEGFEWLVVDDHDNSVFAFERKAKMAIR